MSSSSSFPQVVPQHCLNVPVLYELLKGEEEQCRVWLRAEMNQIADPLIDSLFHGLIMSSSSSSAVPQSRPTVSELCELLKGEKVVTRSVLKGEMDRLVNTLFERLTNKLRTNLDDVDREEEDGDDRAQVGNLLDQVESTNPVAHQQHSNGDEVQLNTVEMIEIKEEVEDGEETRIIDMETLTQDRQVKREIKEEENEMTLHNDQIGDWVKREIKEEEEDGEMVEVKEEIKEEDEEEDGEVVEVKEEEEDREAQINDIEGWAEDNQDGNDETRSVEKASTRDHSTGQSQPIFKQSTRVSKRKQTDQEHLLNIPNQSDDRTVTQSADLLSPSTSTSQDSTRTAKRSKKRLENEDGEDDEDGKDFEDREEAKIKVLHLNCTESNCNVKLNSLDVLYDHLRTVHRLSPFQCFATNCNARFDNPQQMSAHNKLHHYRNTRFLCAVCRQEFDLQHNAYVHWYQYHLNGQFKCNIVKDCAQVTDTRAKMATHRRTAHLSQSKHLHCTHPGCTASFAFKDRLKTHEQIHLNSQPFHCNWHQCSHRTNRRSSLVTHIRTQHFGLPKSMKAQKAKNIVDLRDPNEYVRVCYKIAKPIYCILKGEHMYTREEAHAN